MSIFRGELQFGLLPTATRLPPYLRSSVSALFGLREVVVPKHGHTPREVKVAFVDIEGGPPIPELHDVIAIRRAGIWRHRVRNRRIADLAFVLATKRYPTAYMRDPIVELLPLEGGNRVAVLTENLEHALSLAKYLLGEPIITGERRWVYPDFLGQATSCQ